MNKMTSDTIINILGDYLKDFDSDKVERLKRIKELQDFLSFNQRLTELTDEEQEDFVKTMEGGSMTKNMQETLDKCTNENQKNHYINMWSRSTYFRQCDWMSYLHGNSPNKPLIN